VHALLAKAVDPAASEHEARTSAMLAAKLIARHRFAVVLEGKAAPAPPLEHAPIVTPERVDRWTELAEDAIDTLDHGFTTFREFVRSVQGPGPSTRRRRRMHPRA
jgi:hypothetical protein